MKPFDLEAAKRGEPICTRDGRKAWFVGVTTRTPTPKFPLVVEVDCSHIEGEYRKYDITGVQYRDNIKRDGDLFMAPRKHTAWVNVWIFSEDKTSSSQVFDSKNAAQMNASELRNKGRTVIAEAVPVEWEE